MGNFTDTAMARHGFLLSDGSFSTFDPPGAFRTTPTQINDAGQIVGFYRDSSPFSRGFVLSGGVFTPIDVPGSIGTFPSGINNHGDVVGGYFDILGVEHSFIWNSGHFNYISPPFLENSELHDINDHGDLAGVYYATGSPDAFGFVETGSTFAAYSLPNQPLTFPFSVTNHDVIAGTFQDHFTFHAFVNRGSNFVRVDVPGAGFTQGQDIDDDQGRIVGYFFRGGTHGFMATPTKSTFKK